MVGNYVKMASRNLMKDRLFSILNILGLAGGLATGLLMLLWVRDEQSFDQHHPNVERIYREVSHFNTAGEIETWPGNPAPHAAYALREIPEVEMALRLAQTGSPLVQYGEVSQVEKEGIFADTSFFRMFKTSILAGDPGRPFGDINSIVVTQSFGEKYFGAATAPAAMLSKVITVDNVPLTVTAVIADTKENTAFDHDYIRPYEFIKSKFRGNGEWKLKDEDWGNFDCRTYFLLRPGASTEAVGKKLGDIQHAHNRHDSGSFYSLQPLTQMHLYDADGKDSGAQMVRIMTFAALFILLIACINYINLTTAKATQRAQEVGLRKAIGAGRGQLIGQFLTECALVFIPAAVLALTIAQIALPFCNQLTGKTLKIDWANPQLLLLLSAVLLGALLLSAVYPAMVLSSFRPVAALKGRIFKGPDGQSTLRKGLVVLQFMCTVVLLLGMLTIGMQLNYIRTKNLGYDRENVFMLELSEATYKNRDAFMQELKNSPGVVGVTSASDDILSTGSTTGDLKWEGKTDDRNITIAPVAVAPDFMNFFNFKLVDGEQFRGTAADSAHFILNETAVARMGLTNPIGKRMTLWEQEGMVIGVVKDFHFASLRDAIKPAVFFSNPEWAGGIYIKTTGQNAPQAISSAQAAWKKFDQKYPFDYRFMDEAFDKMYKREARTADLFKAFSGVALFISCLGLFGLATFTAQRRTKEIGIRKVLGASVASVVSLLAKDFMALVAVAVLLASPIAWYFMQRWLSNFAYHIDIQWWMFAAVGLIAVLIAFLTVSSQSIKAALANPVKSLRSE